MYTYLFHCFLRDTYHSWLPLCSSSQKGESRTDTRKPTLLALPVRQTSHGLPLRPIDCFCCASSSSLCITAMCWYQRASEGDRSCCQLLSSCHEYLPLLPGDVSSPLHLPRKLQFSSCLSTFFYFVYWTRSAALTLSDCSASPQKLSHHASASSISTTRSSAAVPLTAERGSCFLLLVRVVCSATVAGNRPLSYLPACPNCSKGCLPECTPQMLHLLGLLDTHDLLAYRKFLAKASLLRRAPQGVLVRSFLWIISFWRRRCNWQVQRNTVRKVAVTRVIVFKGQKCGWNSN